MLEDYRNVIKEGETKLRKHYIDNIRTLGILLLFPFHTCRIFNSFESFYVVGKPNSICDTFILLTSEWFMPLLFTIAGISASIALSKRSTKQFIKERFFKLFIPFIFGVILTVPIQTFFAEKQHNGYTGSYLEQYTLFFTKITDLSGYKGGLTPAHLWFLLFLFIISLMALPLILGCNKFNINISDKQFSLYTILPLFIFNFILSVFEIGGQSFGKYLSFYLLGYFILSTNNAIKLLENKRLLLTTLGILFSVIRIGIFNIIYYQNTSFTVTFLASAFNHLTTWVIILAALGLGKHYLDFTNNILGYFAKASFPIYFFHQTLLVAIGYYILNITHNTLIQFGSIMISTFIASILTYQIMRKIPITRFMFGIKNKQKLK